jgi:cell division protein FtsB
MSAVERLFPRGMTRAEIKTLRWGLIILVWAPMLALVVWGKGGFLDLLQMKREVANLQAEIDTLRRENETLRRDILRLQTDPNAYEGPAREMLLRKKKGEIVLYIPPAGGSPKPPAGVVPGAPPAPANSPVANAPPPAPAPANSPLTNAGPPVASAEPSPPPPSHPSPNAPTPPSVPADNSPSPKPPANAPVSAVNPPAERSGG